MSRRKVSAKREIIPDPVFNSTLVAKFINHIMVEGKRSVAEKIVYGAFLQLLKRQAKKEGSEGDKGGDAVSGGTQQLSLGNKRKVLSLFDEVLKNLKPSVEVRSRRIGGSTYQVPVEVSEYRQIALAMRWLVAAAKARSEKGMLGQLAAEMSDAIENRGAAAKKREDVYKMAKANQAFAHFRW